MEVLDIANGCYTSDQLEEIALVRRYPHSRSEDITDAWMRGYKAGRKDGEKLERDRQALLRKVR